MAVDHGVHVRAQLVDLAVNEPLPVDGAAARIDRVAVEVEGDEVADRHIPWGDRLHLQVPIGITGVANADMAEGVENAVMGEDVVGRDQVDGKCGIEIGVVWTELPHLISLEDLTHRPCALPVPTATKLKIMRCAYGAGKALFTPA